MRFNSGTTFACASAVRVHSYFQAQRMLIIVRISHDCITGFKLQTGVNHLIYVELETFYWIYIKN